MNTLICHCLSPHTKYLIASPQKKKTAVSLFPFSLSLHVLLLGASYTGNHSFVCSGCKCSCHCTGTQSHSDPGCSAWCFCHLLVSLFHLLHIHGNVGRGPSEQTDSLYRSLVGIPQLCTEPHSLPSLKPGFPSGMRTAALL